MIKRLKRMLFGVKKPIGRSEQQMTIKNGKRTIELDEGDSVLILKENKTSIIIDSGNPQLTEADELVAMVWCYLANPEFVKIMRSMFSDVIDAINSDKIRDGLTLGRSGKYVTSEKEEKDND